MKTHFCLSALYCCVQSSKSFWFISMNSLSALYIKPWIVLKDVQTINYQLKYASSFTWYTKLYSYNYTIINY